MKPFIHDDFLLDTKQAVELYHRFAKDLPIIDYHCHLPPDQVAKDHRFTNMTDIWLRGDHYKWRAMRTNGVAERFCTGDASDREKFDQWAAVVPKLLRNPLYHWSHLELNRPFGISDRLLSPATADSIWNDSNALLAKPAFSARGIMQQMKVEVVCTTDDPADNLEHHNAIAADKGFAVKVLPTWRPDKAMAIEDTKVWNGYIERLSTASGVRIQSFADLLNALQKRHDVFHAAGCRLSDHGLEGFPGDPSSDAEASAIVSELLAGKAIDAARTERFQARMMHEFALQDQAKGWVQQLHIGPLRNPNTRRFRALGPDTGFDCIGDKSYIRNLAAFLDRLDVDDRLPRTIIYNINPRENDALAVLIGSFQDGITAGKIQFGSAWWFLDQLDGMTKQIEALSQLGTLSRFVGMLTDSRSFLSYTRHEYFRRLLCRILGRDMAGGQVPDDLDMVGNMVADISYRNAKAYFAF